MGIQNYHTLVDAPGGDYIHFEQRLNRTYVDDEGNTFRSVAKLMSTPADASDALDNDLPILFTTKHHATVQTKLVYQVAPGGPVVFKGGELWGSCSPMNSSRLPPAYLAMWRDDCREALRNHQALRCWPLMNDLSKYQEWLPTSWCKLASRPEMNSSSSGRSCNCKVAPMVASPNSVRSQY